MQMTFVAVDSTDQIDTLAALAKQIWTEYWPDIIGEEQTEYMVNKFLSTSAIAEQIANQSYEYYFINDGQDNVGFIGIKPDTNKMFLSKLYLLKEARGKGYSSEVFKYLQGLCRGRGLDAIWLTVNKNNKHAIDVYKVKGFETVRTQTEPIGEGYVMDDFIMEMPVSG